MKTPYRQMERIVKGVANHRRIQMLELLDQETELDLITIARRLRINAKTCGEHTRRLFIAGHVLKRNESARVLHSLSPLGKSFLEFLRTVA